MNTRRLKRVQMLVLLGHVGFLAPIGGCTAVGDADVESTDLTSRRSIFGNADPVALTLRLPWRDINGLQKEAAASSVCKATLATLQASTTSAADTEELAKRKTELLACVSDPPKQKYAVAIGKAFEPVLSGTAKVRGQTSVQDCEFKKLTIEVDDPKKESTALADTTKIKLQNLCNAAGVDSSLRRGGDSVTWRQGALYPMLSALGLPTVRSAVANIAYEDTSTATATVTPYSARNGYALLLEGAGPIAKTLGGRHLEDAEVEAQGDYGTRFDPQHLLRTMLFQALIQNDDWEFGATRTKPVPMRNFEVIEKSSPGAPNLLLVSHDFDLSNAVNGFLDNDAASASPTLADGAKTPLTSESHKPLTARTSYLIGALVREGFISRAFFKAEFPAAMTHYLAKKDALYAIAKKANYAKQDATGRALLLRHLDAFYECLAESKSITAFIAKLKLIGQ